MNYLVYQKAYIDMDIIRNTGNVEKYIHISQFADQSGYLHKDYLQYTGLMPGF
jgi:hypothetical protein